MTTDIETTTMGTVARWMWVLSLNEDQLEQQLRWEDLTDQERSEWRRKAVTIVDAAEPIWAERVRKVRDRGVWDHAVRAIQELVDEDGMIDQHRLIKLRNPYA
ncbi:hypothetical protein SEA_PAULODIABOLI_53 [Microbacterium phage PauloDiaboli]|nr:hypothetical protein SEA_PAULODIABOLI_53 [Microbacterium phage PauloDiaboli]